MANNEKLLTFLKEKTENVSLGDGTPVYAPQRDVVTLFMLAVTEAWEDLDMEPKSRYTLLAEKWGFDKNRLLETYNRYIDMLNTFHFDQAATIDEAAVLSGFADTDPRLTMLIEAMVGRYMAAAWFYGVKDITIQGETPPPFAGYEDLQTLFQEVRLELDGIETEKAASIKEARNANENTSTDRESIQAEGSETGEGTGTSSDGDSGGTVS